MIQQCETGDRIAFENLGRIDAVSVRLQRENPYGLVCLLDIVKLMKPELLMDVARALWIDASMFPAPGDSLHRASVAHLRAELQKCASLCSGLDLPVSGLI